MDQTDLKVHFQVRAHDPIICKYLCFYIYEQLELFYSISRSIRRSEGSSVRFVMPVLLHQNIYGATVSFTPKSVHLLVTCVISRLHNR